MCVLARVHQTSRAYRAKMLAQNAGAPKTRSAHGCCSAHSAFRRHVLPRGGRWGAARVRSLSPPCRAKPSEVGSASWLASQSALPAAHIICARTWGETTRSQYTVPRKLACARRLIWPIRALRQQAATYGSEWPRESGAHPWRVPTHSGFTRPRSGMKGPDWGLAGAGTTVKEARHMRLVFCPSRFRTVLGF